MTELTPTEIRRIEAMWKSDVDLKLDRMETRLQTIERLVWTAVGGTVVIAAITTLGISIVAKQGDRVDAVAMRQAAAISERLANEQSMKSEIARIRAVVEK